MTKIRKSSVAFFHRGSTAVAWQIVVINYVSIIVRWRTVGVICQRFVRGCVDAMKVGDWNPLSLMTLLRLVDIELIGVVLPQRIVGLISLKGWQGL